MLVYDFQQQKVVLETNLIVGCGHICFSEDGRFIFATTGNDQNLMKLDVANGEIKKELFMGMYIQKVISFGEVVVCNNTTSQLVVIDIETFEVVQQVNIQQHANCLYYY